MNINKHGQNLLDKKIYLKKNYSYKFESILLLLTIIGLVLQFFYLFLRIELNSDIVSPGLMMIEFSKYHNYLLSYYYLPYADPFTFEVVVFHSLPQILSNYNPVMLKIVAFLYLVFMVIVFSYIIFFSTGKLLNALFFSALLSNWNWHNYGMGHDFTILAIGILLMLYFFKPMKNWDIIFLGILAIETWSDSLILIWFTIPILFTIVIINISKRQMKEQIISFLKFDLVFKIVFISSIVMISKKFIKYYMNAAYVQCEELSCLINVQIPALIKELLLISDGQIKFIDTLFFIFLIAYVILLIKNFKSISKKDILIFVGIMFVTTSLFCIVTFINRENFRYLKFILIGIFSVFCLVDFDKSKYAKWILLGFIIINLIYIIDIPYNTRPPNEEQYQLIDFLKKSNLSFGYGEYWDSGIITYLSNEDVTIRPVIIENGLVPFYWMGAKRWYEDHPKKFFIIVRTTNEKALNYYYNNSKPVQIIDYKNYKIFEYNNTI